jgi:hypothetical protein
MNPKTVLLIFHLLGVVCGVGGVLMLDTHLIRHLRGTRVTLQDVALTRFVSVFVKVGLIAVWVSGLLIIASAPMQVLGRILYRPLLQQAGRSEGRGAAAALTGTAEADEVSGQDPLELAREAGHVAVLDCVSLESVVQVFGTLKTEKERQQFRIGMLEALRENSEHLVASVAGDSILRRKIATIAPHLAPPESHQDRVVGQPNNAKRFAIEEWHETLLELTTQASQARHPPSVREAA